MRSSADYLWNSRCYKLTKFINEEFQVNIVYENSILNGFLIWKFFVYKSYKFLPREQGVRVEGRPQLHEIELKMQIYYIMFSDLNYIPRLMITNVFSKLCEKMYLPRSVSICLSLSSLLFPYFPLSLSLNFF